jgi:site-specific recombinase XerD
MSQNDLIGLAKEYVRSLKIRNLAHGTITGRGWRLAKFLDYLDAQGITHMDGITKEVVTAYQVEIYECLNTKGRPNTISYQNTMLSAVKQFLHFLTQLHAFLRF